MGFLGLCLAERGLSRLVGIRLVTAEMDGAQRFLEAPVGVGIGRPNETRFSIISRRV